MGQADVAKAHKYAIERFAEDLLPVKDALEQALATESASLEQLREGVELTLKTLAAAFDKASIAVIDPVGEKFDPHRHQAMTMVPSTQAGQHRRPGVPEGLPAARPRAAPRARRRVERPRRRRLESAAAKPHLSARQNHTA